MFISILRPFSVHWLQYQNNTWQEIRINIRITRVWVHLNKKALFCAKLPGNIGNCYITQSFEYLLWQCRTRGFRWGSYKECSVNTVLSVTIQETREHSLDKFRSRSLHTIEGCIWRKILAYTSKPKHICISVYPALPVIKTMALTNGTSFFCLLLCCLANSNAESAEGEYFKKRATK